MPSPTPCQTQTTTIPGKVGQIEITITCPTQKTNNMPFGVICHPHPLYGGTMHNKVVYIIANTFNALGLGAIRFNFRGVGQTEGSFDHGNGETEDLQTVVKWLDIEYTPSELWLAGFSFGSYVALRGCQTVQAKRLLLVAPAVERFDFANLQLPDIPSLIIQGRQDQIISPEAVAHWVQQQTHTPEFVWLEAADHFFHGQLNLLRDTIKAHWE